MADIPGLLTPGNVDLNNRPVTQNPDGTYSTVRSMSLEEDGKEILVPTIADDGRTLTDQEAVDQYHASGKHLGVFDTPENATAYAQGLHEAQAKLYAGQAKHVYPTLAIGGPEPDINKAPAPELYPTPADVAGAAFRRENEIWSAVVNEMNGIDPFKAEPGFDFQKAAKDAGHEQYLDRYAHVFNQRAADALTAKINREDNDQRIIAAGGLGGYIMSAVAGLASPTMLLPGGEILQGAKGGASVLRTAGATALALSGATAAQEAALQESQVTRTPQESVFAIGGGAILGAAAGSVVAKLFSAAERRAAVAAIDHTVNAPEVAGEFADPAAALRDVVLQQRAAAAGAEVTAAPKIEDLTIAGTAARKVAEETAFLNPGLRLMTHSFATLRDAGDKLFEFSLYLNKHFGPMGTRTPESVEELVQTHMGKLAGSIEDSAKLWREYRANGGTFTKSQWWEEVGKAMQEGDKHPVPQVASMASIFRRDVVAPLTKAAIETGLLPPDIKVTTAASYFSRVWNRQKIVETEPEFRGVIRDWLKGTLEGDVTRMKESRDKRVAGINQQIADLTMPAAERAALLKTLPEQLRKLRDDNADFHALDEAMSDMRREAARRTAAGLRDTEEFSVGPDGKMVKTLKGGPREIAQNIKATTEAVGADYANYVTKRAGIQQRISTIRRNVVGSEAEVERLRGRLVDAEASNIQRLQRLHDSLSKLDSEVAARDPSLLGEKLSAAHTAFAKIMGRSNASQDRLARRLAKLRQEAEKPDERAAAGLPRRPDPVPEDLTDILKNSREPLPRNPETTMPQHPVRAMLRQMGGVDPDGKLAAELAHAGITPQNARGLFKKGGLNSADNLVGSEHELFRERTGTVEGDLAGKGYIKQDAIIEALKSEQGGSPWRTLDELGRVDEYNRHVDAQDFYREALSDMGIDVAKMTDAEIMDRLGDVAFQRRVLAEMDAAEGARTGEGDAGAAAPPARPEDAAASKQERALQLFEAAERKRMGDLTRVSEQIATLEAVDPQGALNLLRDTIDQRLRDAAGTVEREALRMDNLARRMDAADPKKVEGLVGDLRKRAKAVQDEFDQKMEGLDESNGHKAYLDEVENGIVDKLAGRGTNPADLPHNLVVTTKGPLKERRLGIEDVKVRKWLDMNAERGMGRLVRVLGAEVELSRAFKDTPDLKATFAKIEAEAADKRAALEAVMRPGDKAGAHAAVDATADARVKAANDEIATVKAGNNGDATLRLERLQKSIAAAEADRKAGHANVDQAKTMTEAEKQAARLDIEKQKSAGVTDLSALRDILRGTYRADENNTTLARVLGVANVVNYMAKLGGVVASSLNDAIRPMMLHGMGAYLQDGLMPLIANLKAIKASRRDGLLGGALSERVNMGYIASYAEVLDPYARKSPFERFVDNMARVYSKYGNFILPWTDWVKTIDYMIAQARVTRNIRNWSKLDDNERAFMRLMHVDDNQARQIAEQLDKHATTEGGVEVANSHLWDKTPNGEAARRAFDAGMIKDTRTGIVTPGVADKPLMMHGPVGRALGQFQSYTLAAHSRIMLRSMQGIEKGTDAGTVGVLLGMTAAVSMGMFTYWLKTVESGRELSDNPGKWLAEGLDRSGLMTSFFLVNNTIEKLSGYGGYGALASVFPDKQQGLPSSRYRDRSFTGTLAGPTGDLVDTMLKIIVNGSQGKLSKTDARGLKRLAPYASVPEVNWYLNRALAN